MPYLFLFQHTNRIPQRFATSTRSPSATSGRRLSCTLRLPRPARAISVSHLFLLPRYTILNISLPQVSAFSHADAESEWIVEPTKELPPFGRGRIVRQKDIITLRHVASNETLASAPGASPFRSRFTTVADDEPSANLNSTHFRILIDEAHDGQQWLSKVGPFSLIHVPLEVAIVTRRNNSVLNDKLDVSGSRHLTDDAAVWLVDDIIRPASKSCFIYLLFLPPFVSRCRAHRHDWPPQTEGEAPDLPPVLAQVCRAPAAHAGAKRRNHG